jgi:uridine kinase
VNAIQKAFPKVKIITGAIDDDLSERWLMAHGDALEGAIGRKVWVIEPGLGNIGGPYILCRAIFLLTSHEPMCE